MPYASSPCRPVRPLVSTTLSVTASSAAIDLPTNAEPSPSGIPGDAMGRTLVLMNVGDAEAFYEIGSSGSVTATAPTTDGVAHSHPIPPGAIFSLSISYSDMAIAAICLSGQTTSLRMSLGNGGI